MRGSTMLLVALLCGVVAGEEPWDLTNPPTSLRAQRERKEADEAWQAARPAWEDVQAGKDIEPDVLKAAIASIEECVATYEESLRLEWSSDANLTLADAVRAWFALRARLPAPETADQEQVEKENKQRLLDARKFLLEYGRARRYESQYMRCPRCDGRKDLRSPFGDVRPCQTCRRSGALAKREGIIEAQWLCYSPLYRADARNQTVINRTLRTADVEPRRLAPFLKSAAIDGQPEDHGDWIRVKTKEKVLKEPGSRKTEEVKASYDIFRVGRIWYIYARRYDRDLFEIPEDG